MRICLCYELLSPRFPQMQYIRIVLDQSFRLVQIRRPRGKRTQSNACRKSQYIHQTEPRLLASQKQERLVLTCPVTQKRGLCPKKVDDMQPPQCSLVIRGIPSWQLSWSTFARFSARACCETISHERLLVTVCRVQ